MDDAALLRALAAATPFDAARILQKTLADNDVDLLTPKLLAAVDHGAIPPAIFVIYLSNTRHLGTLLAALQSRSSTIRRGAIKHAGKLLRSEHEFDKTWNALGGAPGIAALMRSLSLDDVDRLCRAVGTDSAGSKFSAAALAKRQQAVSQLLDLVSVLDPSKPTSMSDASFHRDPRPLEHLYAYLTPACTEQAREQWWIKQNPGKEKPKPSRPYPLWLEPGQEAKLHADIELDHQTYTMDGIRWLLSHEKKHLEGILHSIAKADVQELEIKPAVFFNSNILPLAVSLPRKKLPSGMKAHIWDMIASSLQRWPLMAEQLDFSRGGLIRLAISRWDYAPTKESHTRAGNILCNLLKLVPSTKVPSMEQWFQSGFFHIKPQHKYQLLLWLFRLTKRFGVDMEVPTEQDKEKLKQIQRFPIELFQEGLMPREKAVVFLHALAEIRPDKTFLRPANNSYRMSTIFSIYQSPNSPSPCGDFEALHHHLFTYLPPPDHPKYASVNSHVPSAAEATKLRMDKAAKGRDAEDRFFWAQSALFMAIAAGSLALYSHTLTWTRRFDRDWQTLKLLYDADTLLTKEGVGLLSGIPSRPQLPFTTLSEIMTAMSAASQVVSQMFETAAASIREPTFSSSNWSCLGSLIRDIVKCRFRRVETLQEHYGLSDDEVYALVWKPTMDMLLSVEKFALQDEHKELRLAKRPGFLRDLDLESLQNHTWSFLDNLAKSRDELWHKERVRRFPSVLTLPAPWPKGLPVADLCAHRYGKAPLKLPYVVSRAEAVLFASPETLLSPMPSDLEFQKAAGGFCDDYQACFDIYISGWPGTDGLSREERVARVWRYATTELTGPRMDKDEARSFWQTHVFRPLENWLPNPPEPLPPKLAAPVFPRTEDPSEPAEWHPDPGVRSQGSERELDGPVTCLDCMVSSLAQFSTTTPFGASESLPSMSRLVVKTPPTPSFWDMQQYKRPFSGESQDAFIATALLSLQSKGGSGGLLMEPFPSPSLARFPAVYLSDEFLEEMGPAPRRSTNLELFQHFIPPALLLRLATIMGQRVMKAIGTDGVTWQERDSAFRVIKLLARCDQPGMARDIIRDIVLDNQDLSFWHRHLFSNGYFSRLSADEAKQFLDGISDAMIQRLKDQAQRRDAGASQESAAGLHPAIKVSTVKMLAQILRGAKFVGHETVCSTLGKILENARHIDIRIAVVQSLVDLFLSSRDAIELQTEVFDILKAHAVPLAASLSEREGIMSEEKWVSAEKEGVLPPHEEGAGDVKALLLGVKDSQLSPDWGRRWAKEILGEAMVQSSKNQARWQALFLKINNLSMPEGEDLPIIAACKDLQLEFLMNRPLYMDQAYFQRLVKLILVNLEPGPGLASINSKIRKEPGLKVSQAGNLWLSRYGNDGWSALDLGPTHAAKLLLRPSFWLSMPTDSGITVPLIQDFLYNIADIYIRKSDLTSFAVFVQRLNVTDSYSTTEAAWKANIVPLLKRLITRIDELRTPEWQHNPQRRPSRLPNTFGIRVKLLPFPSNRSDNKGTPPSDGEIFMLAEALKALIAELVNRGTPFQEDWTSLRAAATQGSRSQAEFPRIALALAEDIVPALERDGGRQPNLAESLRVELAAELIRLGHDPKDDEVLWRVWDMMNRDWAHSSVEFLRDRARTTVEELMLVEAKRGGVKFWGRIHKEALTRAASLGGAKEMEVTGVEVEGEGVEDAVTLRQAWGW